MGMILGAQAGSMVDFSGSAAGEKWSSGQFFPKGENLFQYMASDKDNPKGSTSTATIVNSPLTSAPALLLETTPRVASATGQPFGWIRDRQSKSSAGRNLHWKVVFDIVRPGDGSGLFFALLSGPNSGASALSLDQVQAMENKVSAKPALVVGCNLFFNKGMLGVQVRRLSTGSEGVKTFCYNVNAKKWQEGGIPLPRALKTGTLYSVEVGYNSSNGEILLVLTDESSGKILAEVAFPQSEIDPAVDVSSLRLGAGDLLSNSGSNWAITIHSIESNE